MTDFDTQIANITEQWRAAEAHLKDLQKELDQLKKGVVPERYFDIVFTPISAIEEGIKSTTNKIAISLERTLYYLVKYLEAEKGLDLKKFERFCVIQWYAERLAPEVLDKEAKVSSLQASLRSYPQTLTVVEQKKAMALYESGDITKDEYEKTLSKIAKKYKTELPPEPEPPPTILNLPPPLAPEPSKKPFTGQPKNTRRQDLIARNTPIEP